METILNNNFNQPYIKNGLSIGLSVLGALCTTKGLKLAGTKAIRQITRKTGIINIRNKNEIYKNASKIVLKRENIDFVDLAVTKDAFNIKPNPKQRTKSKNIIDTLNSYIEVLFRFKSMKKIQQEKIQKQQVYYSGNNACINHNKVYANFDKAAFAVPHEMGHIKNSQSKGFAKYLQLMRNVWFSRIGLGIAYSGAILLQLQKYNNINRESDFLSKTKNFIKNNCVTIGAVTVLPVILEEGLASLKAHKLMKDTLSKPDLKLMDKANAEALLSYIFAKSAIIGGIYLADKIRNHTAPNLEAD